MKIAETIYTHFQKGHFHLFLLCYANYFLNTRVLTTAPSGPIILSLIVLSSLMGYFPLKITF